MVFSLCNFPLCFVLYVLSFVPHTMEDTYMFQGVAYIAIKFVRDKELNCVLAGWLSNGPFGAQDCEARSYWAFG